MKTKLKTKLQEKLKKLDKIIRKGNPDEEKRNMTWFWENHINESCNLQYSTFCNQLSVRGTMRNDVQGIIEKFVGKK